MRNLIDSSTAKGRIHQLAISRTLGSRARIGLLAATLSCLSFGANAETGTITFVGSVVTPTCQVSTDTSVHDAAADHSCGLEKDKSVRTYRLTTQAIQADSNDQVLRYFFNYLTSAEGHAQHPVLMTLQYD